MFKTKVVRGKEGHDFVCSCGFQSTGWASKKQAEDRGLLHAGEHETGEPGPELADIRDLVGFK
jgi:hypothetical protein